MKASGVLDAYHVWFSRYVDNNSWDMRSILQFHGYQEVARWRAMKMQHPAGLPRDAVESVAAIETYPADLMRHEHTAATPESPVYMVIPYTYSVPTPEYVKYFGDYVRPQVQGWMKAVVLSGYSLYLQRYTAARPWDSPGAGIQGRCVA